MSKDRFERIEKEINLLAATYRAYGIDLVKMYKDYINSRLIELNAWEGFQLINQYTISDDILNEFYAQLPPLKRKRIEDAPPNEYHNIISLSMNHPIKADAVQKRKGYAVPIYINDKMYSVEEQIELKLIEV